MKQKEGMVDVIIQVKLSRLIPGLDARLHYFAL